MGYEIDFLPVGNESKGGDAIAFRYGNLHGLRREQTVGIIDGGYTECGDALIEHVEKYYATDRADFVVSTHTDQDHICGLKTVLEKMRVEQLLMHLPWDHSAAMERARTSSYWRNKLNDPARRMLEAALELEAIARARRVEVVEPFAGVSTKDGVFSVLGPTELYYEELVTELAAETVEARKQEVPKKLVGEGLYNETLRDDGETSLTNNTSVVTLLDVDGKKLLLTGDAGIPALSHVVDELEENGFSPGDLRFVQVPHHGSRNNVGPTILDRLLGAKGQSDVGTAFVSAPKKNPDNRHPAKKVTNAFRRRGYPVHATQGSTKWHHSSDAPGRSSYSPSQALPLHTLVEDDGGA
ncbi:ComEC/Rec2 family competence protein [Streptomyces prunicolor]|uniref:ComEC/Rec2 family competence protein n=1 Tax=Streptomyces prunicolor TaxID=67348 RepID=UPI000363EE87|nr:MBL fold metallo-hydrolase [Streptomyces prunicolor]